jgi:hypothetical protein
MDPVIQKLIDLYDEESDLTYSVMTQVARRLNLTQEHLKQRLDLVGVLYDTVIFYTGSWPEDQGWGSSDTSAVVRSFLRDSGITLS